MPRRQRTRAGVLAALVLLGTIVAMVPGGATATGVSSTATETDAAASHSPYDRTAVLDLSEAGDDATVAGGVALPENASARTGAGPRALNGTLLRVEDDSVVWRRTFGQPNATTQVADVAVGADGDVYALVATREYGSQPSQPETTVALVHTTDDGDVTWRTELDTSVRTGLAGSGDTLRATDEGVAVAYALPDGAGVRLAEFASNESLWNRTYDVSAAPRSLRTTDDGYLLAGTVGFSTPWVLRTDRSGGVEFNQTVRGAVEQRVLGAVPTDDGGALLAGTQSTAGGPAGANAWVSRLDDEGHTQWSRLYGLGNETNVRSVLPNEDGVLLVEQAPLLASDASGVRLRAVDADGAQLYAETADFDGMVTATDREGDELSLVGVSGLATANLSTTASTVDVPDRGAVNRSGLAADAGITSNETVYRGQNLRVADSVASDETYDLVRLPTEYDEFEPHVVREVTLEDGEAVLESATLPAGKYVLRDGEGDALVLEEGRVTGTGPQSRAAFRLGSQDFFGLETNRTFVNAAAGEGRVELSLRSDRRNYTLHVSARDVDGESVSAGELRGALGDVDGFTGVEEIDGRPVAVLSVEESVRLNASAAAFDAGLYEVTVTSPDTREAGGAATGRLVVAQNATRQVELSLGASALTLSKTGQARTNLTLSGVDNGIRALSLSANRTGEPAVWPDIRLTVNASRKSGSAGGSAGEAEASATAFQARTGNGTVRVGSFGVETQSFGDEGLTTGNNTVTLRVDWVVDRDGVPYAVPDPITVPVEVVNETTGGADDGEIDEGGVGVGNDSETDSDGASNETSAGGSGGESDSGSESDGESSEGSAATEAVAPLSGERSPAAADA